MVTTFVPEIYGMISIGYGIRFYSDEIYMFL